MPQVKVNFGPKVGSAKKTFPPAEKKAPASIGNKGGKVNPFLKNDAAAKKVEPKAEPAPAPAKPQEVKVELKGNQPIKVEVGAPLKAAGSKNPFFIITLFEVG